MNVAHWVRCGIICLSGTLLGLSLAGCVDTTSYQYLARDKGIRQYQAGDYATAAGSFQNALRHEPRDYRSLYYLGLSYDALKMHQKAVANYQAALNVLDTEPSTRRNPQLRAQVLDALARSIAASDDRNAEIDRLEKQAAQDNKAESRYLIARVFQYARDADSALPQYRQAILLDPANPLYPREYGLYLEQLGQTAQAEAALKQAQQLDPEDQQVATALRRLGSVPATPPAQTVLPRSAAPQGPPPSLPPTRPQGPTD